MVALNFPLKPYNYNSPSKPLVIPDSSVHRRLNTVLYFKLGFGLESRAKRTLIMDRIKQKLLWRMGGGCFKGSPRTKKCQKAKIEAVSCRENVVDESLAKAKLVPEHLVIMVNGMMGSAADWRYAAEQFVKKHPDKVVVHCSKCNYSKLTFDGVDLMGERLADEVLAVVRSRPEVRNISFVAHSLGGLVARYAIGRLYECNEKAISSGLTRSSSIKEDPNHKTPCLQQQVEDRIAGLEPMNFITVATPHLGSWGHNQLPMLCGLPFLERSASQTAHWLVGRSGKHLFLTDNDEGRRPLLLRMVTDSYDLRFISALRSFKRRVAYANANYDHVVGWRTSSIRHQHELPKSYLLVNDEKYPHIVFVERESPENVPCSVDPSIVDEVVDFEEEMIRGLNEVPWERVDVSFQSSRQRYVAHNTIQVNTYWLNSDGTDVVFHMIDSFLL